MDIITFINAVIVSVCYSLVVLFLGTLMAKAIFGPLGIALWIGLQIAFFVDMWRKGRARQKH